MTDRPIIFSGAMVAALVAGRKTQTRRLASSPLRRVCVGDRLWVRESFAAEELSHPPKSVPTTPRERRLFGRTTLIATDDLDGADGVRYIADDTWHPIANTREAGEAWSEAFHYGGQRPSGRRGKVIPSIHMPRWASRLTLHVEGIKVEPVQSISNADAWSEGVCQAVEADGRAAFGETCSPEMRRMIVETIYGSGARAFNWLWDSLHTKTGETWSDNPVVIALTFRVERGNIDQVARAA